MRQIFRFMYLFILLSLLCGAGTAFAQKGVVVGKMTYQSGETIIGGSIYIEGTTIGTTTDIDGNYSLEVASGKYVFVYSFIGLETQKHDVEVKEGQTVPLDIVLKETAVMLDQVVVIGYGRRQKRDVTGSIETIKAKELTDAIVPSFEQAIQGRAAGVQITAANGVAGAPVKVNIRGASSITAGGQPLFVVDGIPISSGDYSPGALGSGTSALADLNPNDIESIEILKDAAAAAIYGSRGSNGVVIITTKKGQKGKTKFNAGYFQGVVTETNRLEYLDASEHLALIDRYREEQGLDPMDSSYVLYNYNNWTRHQADSFAALGGTDWVDEVLRVGSIKEANLSASGGSDKTIFYVGGTYRKEDGFLIGNSFERINGRINLENQATDKLKIGTNTGLSFITNNRVPIGDAGGLGLAQQKVPFIPVYNADGTYFDPVNNPVWQLESKSFEAKIFRSITNIYADYEILPDLNFRSEYGLDYLGQVEEEFNFRNTEDPYSVSSAWDRRTTVINWTTNNFFNYHKVFAEKHDAAFTLGNSMQRSKTQGVGLNGWDFANDFYKYPGAADPANQSGYSYYTGFGFVSNFFRVNYKNNDKYLASFSIRNDGSSRFGEDKRNGWFPALSAGWILSEEDFMDSVPHLSFLKVRASLGQTGNASIGDYAAMGYFSPTGGYMGSPGIVPSTLPNSNLTWEKATQFDFTVDYAFLKNRIAGTVTYYYKLTTDMLLFVSLPSSSGYSGIMQNIGSMRNYGYEFTVSSKNLVNKIKWSTDFNFAINRNEVLDVAGLPPDAFESGQPGEGRVIVGYPVGQAYVVQYAGVASEAMTLEVYDSEGNVTGQQNVNAGTALYYDLNGNLMIFDKDNSGNFYENRVPVGFPIPKFVGGITNTFSYGGFDMSFLFSFVYGNTLYDDPAKRQIGDFFNIAQRKEIEDSWSEDNSDSDVPALQGNNYAPVNSDRFIYDASFVRLRNLSVGYKLSSDLCKRLNISNLRIYVTGTNLLTFTKYPGWDPEALRNVDPNSQAGNISFAGPSFQTPQAKTISAGIQIGF